MDRILLLAAALLWGGTLSAQRISTQFLGAFSFMGVRYLAGFLSMLPIVYWEQRYHNHAIDGEKKPFSLVLAAAILAIFLTAGTGFQQLGIFYTTAGKAGFITSLYIVIVPFFAYFVGQPLRRTAIIGSLLAMIGMYFLAYPTDGASFNRRLVYLYPACGPLGCSLCRVYPRCRGILFCQHLQPCLKSACWRSHYPESY